MSKSLRVSNASSVRLEMATKTYGKMSIPAVDSLSLEIDAGEFMTFLGPSGSGKSTVLGMIAGFTSLSSGKIYIAGHDVALVPPHKRNLGMVFQNYSLFPHMTVADNIDFPLRERRLPRAERVEKVLSALEMVRLSDYGSRRPKQLSGGQQQRVALARALVFQPGLLLLDEPLGALDKRLREEMQGEIARLYRELGITCLFVTHDQEEALALSDRIAVFNNGRIEQVGTGKDLYERPTSLFVAQFLGDSTVFHGEVRGVDSFDSGAHGLLAYRGSASSNPNMGSAALVVRPERMRIVTGGASANGNLLPGQVESVVYAGSMRKINVTLAEGKRALVQETSGYYSSSVAGDSVAVAWNAEDSVVIPAEPRRPLAVQ
jgi:putative spermidine/putrescine transport system ATP-binding protein